MALGDDSKLVSLTEKLCSQKTAYISHFGAGFFKWSLRKSMVYGKAFGQCTSRQWRSDVAVATAHLCGACQAAQPSSATLRTAVTTVSTGTSKYGVRDWFCLKKKKTKQGKIYCLERPMAGDSSNQLEVLNLVTWGKTKSGGVRNTLGRSVLEFLMFTQRW